MINLSYAVSTSSQESKPTSYGVILMKEQHVILFLSLIKTTYKKGKTHWDHILKHYSNI